MSTETEWAKAMRRADATRAAFASASELVAHRLIICNRQPTDAERAEWSASYNAWRDAVRESHAILRAERAEAAQ